MFKASSNLTLTRLWNWVTESIPERLERGPVETDCWNRSEWELKEYKWKGSFLVWIVGLVVPVQEIFVLPCLQESAQYKVFSSPYTFSVNLSRLPSKLGRQSCWVTRLLMCVSVVDTLSTMYAGVFDNHLEISIAWHETIQTYIQYSLALS
jgi:hypothetical protein